jgi:hypothetical protein
VRSNNRLEKRDLHFSNRLAVTRLTRVLSASGQNPNRPAVTTVSHVMELQSPTAAASHQ